MCIVEISSNITFKMHENKPLYFYYTFHGKAIKYIQMKLTVNLRQIPRYLFTKKHIYSVFSLLGYDGGDSICARTKTTSDWLLFVRHKNGDFGAISATERSCAAPISKAESHVSDRCSYYTRHLSYRHEKLSSIV